MDGLLLAVLVVVAIAIIVIVALIVTAPPNKTVAIIQDLNIPNFNGNQATLKSITSVPSTVTNITTVDETLTALCNLGSIKRVILAVSSDILSDDRVVAKVKSLFNAGVRFVSTSSTVSSVRNELLPMILYAMPTQDSFIRTQLLPYGSNQASPPGVLLSFGEGLYFSELNAIATDLGLTVYNLTDGRDLTNDEKDIVLAAPCVFISAFQGNQLHLFSQIPPAYDSIINFINIPPSSGINLSTIPDAVFAIGQGQVGLTPIVSNIWNVVNTGIPGVPAASYVACIPSIVQYSEDYWQRLVTLGLLFTGGGGSGVRSNGDYAISTTVAMLNF
jgi:hypothetical protein